MIRTTKYISALLILSILISCGKKNTDSSQLQESFDLAGINVNEWQSKAVIILPNSGCSGCINSVETFLNGSALEYKDKLFLVFTKVASVKTTTIRMGLNSYPAQNYYFDLENRFYDEENVNNYPILIEFKNGSIVFQETVSPDNPNALDSFIERLGLYPETAPN